MRKQYEVLGKVWWDSKKNIFETHNPNILEWVRKEIGRRIKELEINNEYLYRSIVIKGSHWEYFVDSNFEVGRRRLNAPVRQFNECSICGGGWGTHASQCPNNRRI